MRFRAMATAMATLALLAGTSSACGRKPIDATPEGAVEAFLGAIDDAQRDPSAAARAYALLAPESREALRLRAERAASITGQRTKPESMLAPIWSPARFAIDRLQAKPGRDAGHAIVDVYGADPGAQHVVVPVVAEGDRWRVSLAIPASETGAIPASETGAIPASETGAIPASSNAAAASGAPSP